MVDAGTFREDLLYRLAEVVVRLPPLREHRDDIPLLANRILQSNDGPARSLAADAIAYLLEQSWPGNVRELRNMVRRAAALSRGPMVARDLLASLHQVRPSSLPAADGALISERSLVSEHLPLREARRAVEHAYLVRLLERYGEDLDAAARHAGVHKKSLARLIRQHGLTRSG
jgi:two-component system NtrC family response regulator